MGARGSKAKLAPSALELGAQDPPERAMPHATLPSSSSAPAGSAPVIKSCSAAGRKPQELLLATACVAWSHRAWNTRMLGCWDTATWCPSPEKSGSNPHGVWDVQRYFQPQL